MERLSIDEIIEHCKRKTARYEQLNGVETLETADLSYTHIKEYWEHRQVMEYLEELKQYRNLEEQGKLMKFPCKAGTIVYSLECGEIEPFAVASFMNDGENLWFINQYGGFIGIYGQTVFLTESKAEEALQKINKTEA